jgi:spore coat protein CotH
MKNIFSECGFAPPQVRYIRNDPRGAEYGYYEASKNQDGDYVVMRYDADDRIMYRIHMLTEYDFRAWVSETF